MKKTIYFIDSENVNDAWIGLMQTAGEEDELLVFYTAKSPHMSYEKVMTLISAPAKNLQWIRCVEGANALDFQLVSELGYRIAKDEAAQFVIVTNDNGFEAAVRYWMGKGVDIKRMKSSDVNRLAQTMTTEVEEDTTADPALETIVSDEVVDIEEDPKPRKKSTARKKRTTGSDKATTSKKSTKTTRAKKEKTSSEQIEDLEQNSPNGENAKGTKSKELISEATKPIEISDFEDDIKGLAKTIPMSKLTIFHDSFVCLYGQDKGDAMYYAMKAARSEVEKYGKAYLKRADSRNKSYIEFIYTKAGHPKAVADKVAAMYNKMEDPTKNLQNLNSDLIKEYGMALGNDYYKVIKKHIKVMNKL